MELECSSRPVANPWGGAALEEVEPAEAAPPKAVLTGATFRATVVEGVEGAASVDAL